MGDKQNQNKQTSGSMPRESSQVGTHAQTGSTGGDKADKAMRQGEYRGSGSQDKGQGQYQGKGLNKDQGMSQGQGSGQSQGYGQGQGQADWKQGDQATSQADWNTGSQRDMQQGGQTDPAYPSGTDPLDKDEHPVNKTRPVQQNR